MLIMNEKVFIENIINKTEDIPSKFSFKKLIDMIARYYLDDYKENKKELVSKVKSTIESLNISYYVDFKYDKTIKSICSNVFKNSLKLRIVEFVPLYKKELDVINTLENDRDKKLLFTCYIVARFNNSDGWVNINRTDLIKLSNISLTSKERSIKIGELIRNGYLFDAKKNSNLNIKVGVVEDTEEVFMIKNLENIGNQFIALTKKDYKICEECGKLVKIKSKNDNNTKYCEKCRVKIHNRINKESMRKARS